MGKWGRSKGGENGEGLRVGKREMGKGMGLEVGKRGWVKGREKGDG